MMVKSSLVGTAAAVVAASALIAPTPASASRSLLVSWNYFTQNHGDQQGGEMGGQQMFGSPEQEQQQHDGGNNGGGDNGGGNNGGGNNGGGNNGGGGQETTPQDNGGGNNNNGNNWEQQAGQKVREGFLQEDSGNNGNNGNGKGNDKPKKPKTGKVDSGSHSGHGTHYDAIGIPISACGVPAGEYKLSNGGAFPFGALNTNSMFENGAHCGRWMEVTLGQNCYHSAHSQYGVCDIDPQGRWVDDEDTGKVIHVYCADMCPDDNFWCQMDPGHIDISTPYLIETGLRERWNGRKINWSFMDGPPEGMGVMPMKFMWKAGSKFQPGNSAAGFFLSLVVVDTPNGVGKVEQEMSSGGWKEATQLNELGQQYVLNEDHGSTGTFKVKVYDVDMVMYGTYNVEFNGAGGGYVDAPFSEV